MKLIRTLLAAAALAMAHPVQAHYLWLEPVDGQMHLCFGEYENALREKSGGRLDTIAAPEASAAGKQVDLQRSDDHFSVLPAGVQPLVAQDLTMKVKDLRQHRMGIVKPMYYSRFAVAERENASNLDLDIQPMGAGKLRVSLHSKPLAKAKLSLYAPNRWMREYETDASGEIAIHTPWPGLYVAEVAFIEDGRGEYQGAAYEGIRHVSTLSFIP